MKNWKPEEKIPFTLYSNIARDRIDILVKNKFNDLCNAKDELLRNKDNFAHITKQGLDSNVFIDSLKKMLESKKSKLSREESDIIGEETKVCIKIIRIIFPFARKYQAKDYNDNILSLFVLLNNIRNFFSHTKHNEIGLNDKQKNLIIGLYEAVIQQSKKKEILLKIFPSEKLFENNNFSYLGYMFFISLFLTRQEINEFKQLIDEYNPEKEEKKKLYIINNNIYTYWGLRGKSSFDELGTSDTKSKNNIFYWGILEYLKCYPEIAGNSLSEKVKKDYKKRYKDKFMAYGLRYIEDFTLLPDIVFARKKSYDDPKVLLKEKYSFDKKNKKGYNYFFFGKNIFFKFKDKEKAKGRIGMLGINELETLLYLLLFKKNEKKTSSTIETELAKYLSNYSFTPAELKNKNNKELAKNLPGYSKTIIKGEKRERKDIKEAISARIKFLLNSVYDKERLKEINKDEKIRLILKCFSKILSWGKKGEELKKISIGKNIFQKYSMLLNTLNTKKIGALVSELKGTNENDKDKKVNRFSIINSKIKKHWKDFDDIYNKVIKYQINQLKLWQKEIKKEIKNDDLIKIARWLDVRNPENSNIEDVTKMLSNGIAIPRGFFKEIANKEKVSSAIYKNQSNNIKLLEAFYTLEKPKASLSNKIIAEHTKDKLLAFIAEKYFKKVNGDNKIPKVSLIQDSFQNEEVVFKIKNKNIIFKYSDFKQVRSRESSKLLGKIVSFNKFKSQTNINYSTDIVPLLEKYRNSQREYMIKVFEFEKKVIMDKNLSLNKDGYIKFTKVVEHSDIENKDIDIIKKHRRNAFHNNMNDIIDDTFFESSIKKLDDYLK